MSEKRPPKQPEAPVPKLINNSQDLPLNENKNTDKGNSQDKKDK